MNKQELINELKSKTFVKKLTNLEDTKLASDNLKLYAQHYIETGGNVAKETKAHIYVLDEGLETEEAYYKDREPESSVKPTHPLVKKYKNLINQYNGKVVDKGEGFIVVNGYEEVNGEMVNKTWFAKEVNGELAIKTVK